MDRVDIHEAYDPKDHYRLELDDSKLTPEELAAKHGRSIEEPAQEPAVEACESHEGAEPAAPKRKRLDG